MYKHILVAVDGSDTSNRALAEAIALAKDQQAALRIVYTIDEVNINLGTEFPNPPEIEAMVVKSGLEIINQAQDAACTAGVETSIQLIEIDQLGVSIADTIVRDAQDWSTDLIVAGTHGRSGLSHLLMGSVAEGIVRASPVPILLIRSR